ncbi:MAG: NUDIX domain-containing protein [Candidatus Pacebacteria bacterium]|nr:NUDIX domain-containing protein [Candidatus Paceibacterota bacterium]
MSELILTASRKNLERGRAVATGIGLFVAMGNEEKKVLLRRRLEKDSLLGADLSGKWEMVGGGVEISHFKEEEPVSANQRQQYQKAIWYCLSQELREEAGLMLKAPLPKPLLLQPAWILNEKNGIIDLAFVLSLPYKRQYVEETDEFRKKEERGEIRFFSVEELSSIEIVSPRMRFLLYTAIDHYPYD